MNKTDELEIFEFEFYGKAQSKEAIKMIKKGKSVGIKDMPYVFINDKDLLKEKKEVQEFIKAHYFTIDGINEFCKVTNRCLIATRLSLDDVKKILYLKKFETSSELNIY